MTQTKLGQLDTGVHALSTHFQVRIISGYVLSDEASVLWNGQTPLPFPADFNLKPYCSGTQTSDSLHGTFSVQLSSQKWVNGQFFFEVSGDWFHSRPLQVSGNFMSPVYFKDVENYSLPASFPSSVELWQHVFKPKCSHHIRYTNSTYCSRGNIFCQQNSVLVVWGHCINNFQFI